ncbi:MAG: S41 family peptidase [Bacteroides sp.]|nr:S41 family peptidase [Bacteroides sp.]MCM1379727.1 S41 family peptidase [Bacteroides sp.]MCM1446082.1 S41 family peptidase [Prevotella sp.]
MQQNNRTALVGVPVIVTLALLVGILLGSNFNVHKRRSAASDARDKVEEIFSLIESNYVDRVDIDSLLEETIPLMLGNLDPHTAYIPASELQGVNDELGGSFSGIGISFQVMNDTITVLEVISGGPSEKVGLLPGDRIVEVNDTLVAGKHITSDDVMKKLRGPKDTQVKLDIKRAGAPGLLTYTVTRGDIPVTSIDASYIIAPQVGYIKVNKFGRNTFTEFFTQMMMLRANGAEDYILDLRGNGGGFLDIAIRMANEFLPAGAGIVETRGRGGEVHDRVAADGSGTFQKGRLIVLLDEFSASASEIVAGAVQDNDRGTIMGRRSFGKGLVQSQEALSDGSAIRITTARYYTPSGRCIQKPFVKGEADDYALEIYDRYASGEVFSADSVKFDTSLLYHTVSGREVYGGGGIMPDIFVPADTANITSYYTQVSNAGLLHRYAFDYVDANRWRLDEAGSVDELLALLPSDQQLLGDFVSFAASNGVAARWYYINISRPLLVNILKALIARDVLGTAAFYEIDNTRDNAVARALEELK